MKKISKRELKELKGGIINSATGSDTVKNLNKVNGCVCNYLDLNNIENTNSVIDCNCTCTKGKVKTIEYLEVNKEINQF